MWNFFIAYRAVIIEALAIVALLSFLFLTQRHASKWLGAAERKLACVGRQQALSIALVGLLALGASASLSLFGHVRKPIVHDEFSYLLAADTFVRGRLTNPTHPLWVHFESIHIIQQPTYASKYPPAQGLILALGQVIGGHPIVGVWLATGLGSAAVCWMLLAWLPSWWAILGSLLVALHPGILLSWGQTYWGGSMAMAGGALVFGALPRLARRPQVPAAILLGAGLAILANSRPYEGLVVSLPAAVGGIVWFLGKHAPPFQVSLKRIVLPIAAVLMLTAAAMGNYNFRVTGDIVKMPYVVHEATYGMAPVFLWQRPRPEPIYRHEIIRNHHARALVHYTNQQTIAGLKKEIAQKVLDLWNFYQGVHGSRLVLTLPLLMIPWMLRRRWPRFALLTCGVLLAALAVETWVMPHYAAPIVGLVIMLLMQAMRHLRLWRWGGMPAGRFLVWTFWVIAMAFSIVAFTQRMKDTPANWGIERARLLEQLQQDGRRHLVMVRYGTLDIPYERGYREWVYNEADIDGAKVVWAREMDAAQNRKLLEYFKDRVAWLVEVDQYDSPPKLAPYPVHAVQMMSSSP
jgi:hypothetical protein